MWASVLQILIFAIVLVLLPLESSHKLENEMVKNEVSAGLFSLYRERAINYANTNPGISGEINESLFNDPQMWNSSSNFKNRVEGNILYIYSATNPVLTDMVIKASDSSYHIGLNKDGKLISPLYGDTNIVLPQWIPEDDLVSVTGL